MRFERYVRWERKMGFYRRKFEESFHDGEPMGEDIVDTFAYGVCEGEDVGACTLPIVTPVATGIADERETVLEPPFAVNVDSDPRPDRAVIPVRLVWSVFGLALVSECHLRERWISIYAEIDW